MKCPGCGFNADNCKFCPVCGTKLFQEETRFQNPQNRVNYAYPAPVQPQEYEPAKSNGNKPLVIAALVILGATILAGVIISVYSAVVYNQTAFDAFYNESYISGSAVPFSD